MNLKKKKHSPPTASGVLKIETRCQFLRYWGRVLSIWVNGEGGGKVAVTKVPFNKISTKFFIKYLRKILYDD